MIAAFAYKSGLMKGPSETNRDQDVVEQYEMIFFSARPLGDGIVALGADFKTSLTEHPLWIGALEKTLTSEQFDVYRQYRIDQSRKLLHVAIESWVSSLDAQIFLSPQQYVSVTDFMRSELNEKITIEFPASMRQATEVVEKEFAENSDSLGELLTDKQTIVRRALVLEPTGPTVSWGPGPIR